jgi:hypothetical protein
MQSKVVHSIVINIVSHKQTQISPIQSSFCDFSALLLLWTFLIVVRNAPGSNHINMQPRNRKQMGDPLAYPGRTSQVDQPLFMLRFDLAITPISSWSSPPSHLDSYLVSHSSHTIHHGQTRQRPAHRKHQPHAHLVRVVASNPRLTLTTSTEIDPVQERRQAQYRTVEEQEVRHC